MKCRIALLSDLHIGTGARGLDLCPHELDDSAKVGRHSDFISLFEAWARSAAATNGGPFDMLCLTGDISNTAHAEEFVFADRVAQRVASVLGVPDNRIFFVPGNHDVHWPVMELKPPSFWARHRYAPLFQDSLTFSRRHGLAKTGSLMEEPFFVAWEEADAIVIGINSAAYDGPTAKPHNGVIRQRTVEAVDQYLGSFPKTDKRLRLCLLHHHLEQYSEPIPDTHDPSIAVNAENLVNALSRHRVDLVLHGHKHHPRLGARQSGNEHPLVSVCAGSFSAVLHPLYYDGIPNLFHVINVDGREAGTDRIFGKVDTWTFTNNQWRAASGVKGLYASEAFGSAATPAEIEANVRNCLVRRLATEQVCTWQQLVLDCPSLDLVRTDVVYNILQSVSEELNCELNGDRQVIGKKWVVFRRVP